MDLMLLLCWPATPTRALVIDTRFSHLPPLFGVRPPYDQSFGMPTQSCFRRDRSVSLVIFLIITF